MAEKTAAWGVWVRHPVHGDRKWTAASGRVFVTDGNGRDIAMRRWRARCVICGARFEVLAPDPSSTGRSKTFDVLTCEAHRMTPAERRAMSTGKDVKEKKAAFRAFRADKLEAARQERLRRIRARREAADVFE